MPPTNDAPLSVVALMRLLALTQRLAVSNPTAGLLRLILDAAVRL